MYTRCPKCSTCFRVTDRHLAIAKGRVRCGKCQLVFNATEHAIDDLPSNPTSSQTLNTTRPSFTPTAKAEVKKPATTTSAPIQANKMDIPTPTKAKIKKPVQTAEVKKEKTVVPPKVAPPLYQADATLVAGIDDLNHKKLKSVNLDAPSSTQNSFDEDDDSFNNNFDLDAAINELTEHADEITYDHDITDKSKITATTKAEIPTPEEKQGHDVFTTDAYDATNTSSVADILNEMEGQLALDIPDPNKEIEKENYDADDEFVFIELDDEPKAVTEAATEKVEDTNDEFIKNNFDIEEFDIDDEIDELSAEKEKKKDNISKEEELFDSFDIDTFENSDIEEEIIIEETSLDKEAKIGVHSDDYEVPLQLRDDIESLQTPTGRRLHPALKFTFFIFLLALSFTQLAYFRSHELVSIIPSSRPLLEQFCENVGCQYSGPDDTKQIQLQSRDVRLHPKVKKALLISAVMINNAYFAQPYPNIHVRLSDISGNIVAERIFNPKTYMGKLSNPFLLMRSKTPVHINFEVVDPGKDAVNFEFTFL